MMDDGEYGDNKKQTRDKESMRRGWLICFMIIDLKLEEKFLFILVFIHFFFQVLVELVRFNRFQSFELKSN
jgi:hypothetical protein